MYILQEWRSSVLVTSSYCFPCCEWTAALKYSSSPWKWVSFGFYIRGKHHTTVEEVGPLSNVTRDNPAWWIISFEWPSWHFNCSFVGSWDFALSTETGWIPQDVSATWLIRGLMRALYICLFVYKQTNKLMHQWSLLWQACVRHKQYSRLYLWNIAMAATYCVCKRWIFCLYFITTVRWGLTPAIVASLKSKRRTLLYSLKSNVD